LFAKWGENLKRALKTPFLAINAKGGESIFFQNCKTLLNTKRRILLRGSFCVVKGKAFETGGENFKS
jgi:hypothetical protein